MKVYVVTFYDECEPYSGDTIAKVFAHMKDAEAYVEKMNNEMKGDYYHQVSEYEVI